MPALRSLCLLALAFPLLACATTAVRYEALGKQVLDQRQLPRLADARDQALLQKLLDPRRLQPMHFAQGESLAEVCRTAADLQNKYTHASAALHHPLRPSLGRAGTDYRAEFAHFTAFTTRCTAAVLHTFSDIAPAHPTGGDAPIRAVRTPNERVREARAARASAMLQLRLTVGSLGMPNLDEDHLALMLGAAADHADVLANSLSIAERARLAASIQQRMARVPHKAAPHALRLLAALRAWGCTGVCPS
jgi:hypothetical protein